VLVYISSGKCYTYVMCRVWLWVSVFLQACGLLGSYATSSLKMEALNSSKC